MLIVNNHTFTIFNVIYTPRKTNMDQHGYPKIAINDRRHMLETIISAIHVSLETIILAIHVSFR